MRKNLHQKIETQKLPNVYDSKISTIDNIKNKISRYLI